MQMNDIIEGLSSNEYSMMPPPPCNDMGGCGFGSWIWILLILFYTNNQNRGNGSCCRKAKNDCCGTGYNGCTSGAGGYLFLLVVLFLCGCGGYGCGQGSFDGAYSVC